MGAYFWPLFGVTTTYLIGALVLIVLGFLLSKTVQQLPDAPVELNPATQLYLVLGVILTVLYALFGMTTGMVVDGDLFVHGEYPADHRVQSQR